MAVNQKLAIVIGNHYYLPGLKMKKVISKFLQPLVMKSIQNRLLNREALIYRAKNEEKTTCYSLNYEESIYYDNSFAFSPAPPIIEEKKGWFHFTVPFVCEAPNISLIGPHAIGVTQDRKIVLETTLGRESCLDKSITATLEKGFPLQYLKPIKTIDFACSLINCWSDLYAHWLTECLTRLEGLQLYYEETGERPKLVIEKDPPFWKVQSLQMMGYFEEDYILWTDYKARVNRLVIPSNRREERRQSIKACRWVGKRIVNNLKNFQTMDIPFSPNILISRKKANCRRVINEKELNESLAKRGFQSYVLEDLDFPTQVKLFSGAEIVVAPHGAGLTNMIFSKNPIILEFFGEPPSYFFYTLSKGFGFKHGFLMCKPQNQDMIVNCDEVNRLLDIMCEEL